MLLTMFNGNKWYRKPIKIIATIEENYRDLSFWMSHSFVYSTKLLSNRPPMCRRSSKKRWHMAFKTNYILNMIVIKLDVAKNIFV